MPVPAERHPDRQGFEKPNVSVAAYRERGEPAGSRRLNEKVSLGPSGRRWRAWSYCVNSGKSTLIVLVVLIGVGATTIIDLWGMLLQRTLRQASMLRDQLPTLIHGTGRDVPRPLCQYE